MDAKNTILVWNSKGNNIIWKTNNLYMEDQISNARLKFKCNQDWNSMSSNKDGRFCTSCQKTVFDLTDKNTAYFVKIMLENNNNVCGRFTTAQTTSPSSVNKPLRWKNWLIAAMATIGISACSKGSNAQTTKLGKVAPKVIEDNCEIQSILGMVMPAGYISPQNRLRMQKYLFDHCILQKTTNGWFGISYSFTNKELSNISVTGNLSKESKLKLINTVKNSIKLNNDDLKDEFPFQLNVQFEKGRVVSLK
ncbi:MAG TPA: hypothetical protein VKB19_16480 [Pedobacter sp.]|nr:hypothetical protein [Pedobacter sp.]